MSANQDDDDRLDQLLHELGPAEPPPGLVSDVMDRVASLANHGGARRSSVRTNGVTLMTSRKTMWVLAAAAAVVLGIFIVKGFPVVDHGTEATIGAAKRYQAEQLSNKDVTVGDTQVQDFLQSETFDRLIKDDSARQLLSDRSVRAALSNPELAHSLTDNSVRVALTNADVRAAFSDDALRAALSQGIAANVRAQVVNKAVGEAALSSAVVQRILSDASLVAALRNSAVWGALSNAEFRNALKADYAAAALQSPAFAHSVRTPAFANALASHLADAQLSANIVSR
jgi:hypothetical protein